MIIITFKGAVWDLFQSPHCAVSHLQHVRSSGLGAVVYKSCATHRALITCNISCSGMSIFRFSAEFRFFFFDFPLFWKWFSAFFFEKSPPPPPPKFFFSFAETTTIDSSKNFGKQSVTSWFAGMRFFRFRSNFESAESPLSLRKSDARSHVACWRTAWTASTRGRGGWWFSGGMEGGLVVYATPAFAPPPFPPSSLYTHSLSLSLSLSLSQTHTHSFGATSCFDFAMAFYTRAKNATVTYRKIDLIFFSHPETQ